jgi:hypothetical protein
LSQPSFNVHQLILLYQSHTGRALANTFHQMLVDHGIENKVRELYYNLLACADYSLKILAFNGDNATSNDTQTTHLDKLPNSFEELNRVRCFNHTLQLSAKALLRPFNSPKSKPTADADNGDYNAQQLDDSAIGDDISFDLFNRDDLDDDGDEEEEEEEEDDVEEEDPMAALPQVDREALIEDTLAVRTTLDKVSNCQMIHSRNSHSVLGSEALLCCYPLDDHCPPCLA